MKKPTLAELLSTYGIDGPDALHKVIRPYTWDYARKLYHGHEPMTTKVAAKIRKYTGGALTLDALMAQDGR